MSQKLNAHNSKARLGCSFFILILISFCSCTTSHYNFKEPVGNNTRDFSGDISKKINLLQNELAALGDETDYSEAKQLAQISINYSLFLADEYRLVRPPYLHNMLVRIGIKDRGLCYHWAEDLLERLTSLELKSFILHRGVAYKGSDLREHNSVVVTARGQDFNEGIVLDPWRDSGDLYWTRVKIDRYPWEER